MSATISIRLGSDVEQSAQWFIASTGWSRTFLINTALSEWLCMQTHPGIRFVSTPTGSRMAALVDGPEIWTVAESWRQHEPSERSVENLVNATGLTARQVECALAYYADFRDEIEAEVKHVHRAQREARAAWERRRALNG